MAAARCTIRQHASINELPQPAWDSLAGGNFYLSHAWLSVVEIDSRPPPVYLAAWSEDDSLVGALPVYPLDEPPGNHLADPAFVVGGCVADDGWYPALCGGTRIGYSSNILVSSALPASGRAAICQALLDALARHAADSGFRSGSLLYLNSEGAAQLGAAVNWPLVFSTAEAVLDIPWASFEEYLAALTRHRRANVRADLRHFAQSGMEARLVRLGEVEREAAPLAVNVQHKYGHQSSPVRQVRFFGDCARHLGDEALVFGCFDRSELIGFALAFRWQDTLYIRSAGFDYGKLTRQGEHFTVMFYEPIRYAIEHGLTRIHFGTESFAAKAQRGCAFRPLWSAASRDRPFSAAHLRQLSDISKDRLRSWDESYAAVLGYQPSVAWEPAPAGQPA
jgi:predicted N-acyltransferase